ncbi:T9SS type A sorting domain-containing protein [Chryseobacterium indologenes]|uniref:Neutral metalloproteinase n=1 Tax=Chryseobacterium indologenes TaxID=253 RepID=A0A411DKW7_CHRID|nr:T9SS type A sorting domain-containing protein [Chryseobacterium indologenes]
MNGKTTISKKIVINLLLTGAIFFFQINDVSAQNRSEKEQTAMVNLPKFLPLSSMGNFHMDVSGLHLKKEYLMDNLSEWLGVNNEHTFRLIKEEIDPLGIKHTVYQHYYNNVKVMDELLLLHEKGGYLIYVNGELTADINLSIGNSLAEADVKSIISKNLTAGSGPSDLKFSDFETVIAKVDNGRTVVTYLTSKIEVLAARSLKAYTYYINTEDKKIVKKISKTYHVDTPSSSTTLNKGNQQITVDSYNGVFRLKDNSRNIHTLDATDADGGFDPFTGLLTGTSDYVNPTPNFTSDVTKAAVEVHWGLEKTYDYYLTKHNRDSYDGNSSPVNNYYNVDFSLVDSSLPIGAGDNAMAIDFGGYIFMAFGNGNFSSGIPYMNPLVTLDVAGHEFSHLVISRNGLGGLNYEKESGALNESIADMMGTAIEFYSGITPNWTIGEGLMPSHSPDYLRDMGNPNYVNSDNPQQPDTYQGTYWMDTNVTPDETNDYGGVHINSGVGNFWFYLLSQGGSGTNDIGNMYTVNGIGIEKAEKIIYRALVNYLTPNSTYIDAYNATKQAAIDLYGATSNEAQQNVNAWYAVGIGNGQLGINEAKTNENDITIYPNPVKQGYFIINSKQSAMYELYDISGRVIIPSQKLNTGVNKIFTKGVVSGNYILKVSKNGNFITKKIIVE